MIPRARRGLVVLASGVAAFMLALYGVVREASPFVAAAGLVAIVVGAALLLASLRGVALVRPPLALAAVVAAGVALHAWHAAGASGAFALGLLAWSLVPYAVCVVVGLVPALRRAALVGAIVVLAADAYAHYTVFVAPASSTAALALLFAPLWNALVLAPAAMLATWALARRA
jgi:hypothetical protein